MVKIKTGGGGVKIPPAQGGRGRGRRKALRARRLSKRKIKQCLCTGWDLIRKQVLSGLSDTIILNQIEHYLGSKWNNVKFLHCGCTQSLRSHSPFLSLDNPQRHDDQSGTQWMKTK